MQARLREVGFSEVKEVAAPASDVTLVVRRGGVLRGRVLDEEGHPVAAFDATATYNAGRDRRVLRSSHTGGRYALAPIDADSVQLSFRAEHYEGRLLTCSTIPRGRHTDLPDVVLADMPVQSVTGRVLDAVPGDGVPGATVVPGTSPSSGDEPTYTDAAGTFAVALVDAHLYVQAEGYAPQTVAVAAGTDALVVRLTPGGAVRGVLLAEGAPATGSVALFGPAGRPIAHARLDQSAAGAFTFEQLHGDYAVVGFVPGYFTRVVDVHVADGQTVDIRIDVVGEEDGRMHGSVAGLLGDETAFVTLVSLRQGDRQDSSTLNRHASRVRYEHGIRVQTQVPVSSDSRFAVAAVPPGTYHVGLSTSHGRKVGQQATVGAGGNVEVNFRLDSVVAVLTGTVRKENGVADPCDCLVLVGRKDDPHTSRRGSAVSDAGAYRIEGLGTGVYVVDVEERISDAQAPVTHGAGEVEVNDVSIVFDIVIPASARLVGVVQSWGVPVEGAGVELSRTGRPHKIEYLTRSAFDGSFALGGLEPAEYLLRVQKQGYRPFESGADLRTSLAERVAIELVVESD